MTGRRPPWRDLAILAAVALVARVGASLIVPDPAYLDAAYYEVVARALVAGDGFRVPIVWSFLETGGVFPADPVLPVASNRHWMPLTAILSAGSMAALGTSRFAAELPHVVLASLLVPATAWIGWWLWGSRRVAILSGVLALFAGPMLVYLPMVDSFALFGIAGAVALVASMRAAAAGAPGWWLVVAAVALAFATLTRVDGILLGVAPLTAWMVRRGIGPWRVEGTELSGWWLVVGVVAAAVVITPWLVRQWLEFGTLLPSAGGRLLWIRSFNEQFSVTGDPTMASYLELGLPAILAQKLEGIVLLVGRTTVLLGGAFIAPFLYGLWTGRRRPVLAPFIVFWIVHFASMALVFTLHAPAGAYYHSAWAWLPIGIPLAVASGLPLLDALGRRVPMLTRQRNVRFLVGAATAGAIVLSIVGSAALVAQWRREYRVVQAAGAYLAEHATATDVVMYVDPPSLNLLTGNPAVAPPFDPPETIQRVAEEYGVRWMVVERATGAELDALSLWDGADWLGPEPIFEDGDVRIFQLD